VKLSQKQSNAWHYLHDNITTELLYGGAAGGGKSALGCLWHIDRRVSMAGTRGAIGREELKTIKDSTLITYFDIAKKLGYRAGIDFKYNAQEQWIDWDNGSRTVFKEMKYYPTDPNFERLGSTEYTDAFVDEVGEVSEKATEILGSRIRYRLTEFCHQCYFETKKSEVHSILEDGSKVYKCGKCSSLTQGLIPKMLMSANPNHNWVKFKFIKDKKGNPIKLQDYQKYISATVTDNPDKDFVRTYKGQLEKMNEYDKARLLYGDWDAMPKTGGEAYKKFDSKRDTGIFDYNPNLPLFLWWDENVNPYLPCGVFQIENKRIRMIDLFLGVTPNNNIKDVCRQIKSKYIKHKAGMFIGGDATSQKDDVKLEKGHNFYSLIQNELSIFMPQLKLSDSNPSVVMRLMFFNDVLENNFGGWSFMIDKRLHEAIMDFEQTKEAADGRKDKKTVKDNNTGISYQKFGHITDLCDYLLCEVAAEEYEEFQDAGAKNYVRITGNSVRNDKLRL
jgi:hypothetical protein